LCGPYGAGLLPPSGTSGEVTNNLAIAGGTGVSLTLPAVLAAILNPAFNGAAVDFVWIIRRSSNMQWISAELEELQRRSNTKHLNLNIHIYVTQEHNSKATVPVLAHPVGEDKVIDIGTEPLTEADSVPSRSEKDSENPNFKISYFNSRHPSLQDIITCFTETRASFDYRTRVIASGPAGMGYDLGAALAGLNDGGKVWKGERKWDVDLHRDDRMG
jgi:ferric-chelate reductase